MLSTNSSTPDRRGHSRHLIKSLVSSRAETLELFTQLAQKTDGATQKDTHNLLQMFCQALIDYTASAHFQLYQHIDEKRERRQAVLKIADEIYPRIVEITQTIVDFNDKYDCDAHDDNLRTLTADLTRLGAALTDRVALEDRLIKAMCGDCL